CRASRAAPLRRLLDAVRRIPPCRAGRRDRSYARRFRVGVAAEELGELSLVRDPELEEPALLVRRFVDALRRRAELAVRLDDLARERREHVRGGLGRLDHRAAPAALDFCAWFRQLDVDEIAELLGGERGDADGDGAVAVVGDPFMGVGVLQVLWQFHGSLLASVTRACGSSAPPLSVCLRNWRRCSAACSFGEANVAFSPECPSLTRSFCLSV